MSEEARALTRQMRERQQATVVAPVQQKASAEWAAQDEAAEWLKGQDEATQLRATMLAKAKLQAMYGVTTSLDAAPKTFRRRVVYEVASQLRAERETAGAA